MNPPTEFERIYEFSPAFDKRDPEPSKNYGIHGVEIHFVLKGPEGAVSFTLYTGWLLPETVGVERADYRYGKALVENGSYPMPAMLSYHIPEQREDYQVGPTSCRYVEGGQCWGDGSFIADGALDALVTGGSDGLFAFLETWYDDHVRKGE